MVCLRELELKPIISWPGAGIILMLMSSDSSDWTSGLVGAALELQTRPDERLEGKLDVKLGGLSGGQRPRVVAKLGIIAIATLLLSAKPLWTGPGWVCWGELDASGVKLPECKAERGRSIPRPLRTDRMASSLMAVFGEMVARGSKAWNCIVSKPVSKRWNEKRRRKGQTNTMPLLPPRSSLSILL